MKYRIERWSYHVCTDAVETDSWDIIQDVIKTKKFSEDSNNGECVFKVFADGKWVEKPIGPEPKEPLIMDEKIRKAVRAWAEANGIRYVRKCGSLNAYTRRLVGYDALATSYTIEFERHLKLYGDSDKIEKDSYTIAELCGEEEE